MASGTETWLQYTNTVYFIWTLEPQCSAFNFNKSSRQNYRVRPTSIYKGKMKNVLDVFLLGEKVNGKLNGKWHLW